MMKNINPQYFEGILQLRNPSKEVVDFIEKQTEQKENVFITKKEEVRNGIDFYFTSNKYLLNLGKKLQNCFGGELKFSSKLFSRDRQTSKEIHRVNVLFRVPGFKKGDIIKLKGDNIKVINIGKKVFGKNIKTGKKVSINFKDLN